MTPAIDSEDLLPVRMLNEYAYCPRLFHLMHVEGRWEDNAYTEDGRRRHARVDRLDHALPDPESPEDGPTADADGDDPPAISRSVPLASAELGIIAKLDLVSTAGDEAVPVETKRGRVPNNPEKSWEPERVQLMAQGLLLRHHGYRSDHGVLYFAASRRRVDVPFTPELASRTLHLIAAARQAAAATAFPPPLDDSPKCNGCSLAPVCLPDETRALAVIPPDATAPEVRRFYPARDDALPLYVQEQGASVGKSGRHLLVRKSGETLAKVPLKDVSQLVLLGGVSCTPSCLHLLCEAQVPVIHLSRGHWFYGITAGHGLRNAYTRAAQFQVAVQPARCLAFARAIVAAKGANQRTFLRRNATDLPPAIPKRMAHLLERIDQVADPDRLLGFEGAIAAIYFRHFSLLLKHPEAAEAWDFRGRNRRPPRDPVNAMLSYVYALLVKECTVTLLADGLDPWWGFYHRPRHGRPSLALDLMEEFRPLVADSAVITALNTGMVRLTDFQTSKAGCIMQDRARKALIRAYEARLDQLVTHPLFDYRCAWRAVLRLQARLLARWLRGDIPAYIPMTTR